MSTKDKKLQGRVTLTDARRVQYLRDRESAQYYADLMVRRVNVAQWLIDHDEDGSWRQYQVQDHLTDGRSGALELSHYYVPQTDPARFQYMIEGGEDRDCGWGRFVKLTDTRLDRDDDNGNLWMSDTRAEIMEHMPLLKRLAKLQGVQARPTVLITGLGLGMAVRAALLHGASRVDVVELDPDVIALTAPQFASDPRVHVHQGDALTWPDARAGHWDIAWHDIWPTINDDNLAQMGILKRRYRARWTGCWQEEGCRWMDRIIRQKHEYEAVMGPIDRSQGTIDICNGYLDPVIDMLRAKAEAEAGE
jgi:hypothetical protein